MPTPLDPSFAASPFAASPLVAALALAALLALVHALGRRRAPGR